jgi:hypothetical protein
MIGTIGLSGGVAVCLSARLTPGARVPIRRGVVWSLLLFIGPDGGLAPGPVMVRILITCSLLTGWAAQKRKRLVAMESASAPMPLITCDEDVRHYRTTPAR